MTYHVTYT